MNLAVSKQLGSGAAAWRNQHGVWRQDIENVAGISGGGGGVASAKNAHRERTWRGGETASSKRTGVAKKARK
jgi:hypothetical protein